MLEYFNNKLITVIDGKHTKEEILKIMVDLIGENSDALSSDALSNKEDFLENILNREKVGSTGIGLGIALPHARCENIKKIVVAVALLKEPINFNSLDGENVKLLVMLGAPKNQGAEYLSLVGTLMRTFRNKEARNTLLEASNQQELIEAIAELNR